MCPPSPLSPSTLAGNLLCSTFEQETMPILCHEPLLLRRRQGDGWLSLQLWDVSFWSVMVGLKRTQSTYSLWCMVLYESRKLYKLLNTRVKERIYSNDTGDKWYQECIFVITSNIMWYFCTPTHHRWLNGFHGGRHAATFWDVSWRKVREWKEQSCHCEKWR